MGLSSEASPDVLVICAQRNPGLLSQSAAHQTQQLILELSGFLFVCFLFLVCLCASFIPELFRELQAALPVPQVFAGGWYLQLARGTELWRVGS